MLASRVIRGKDEGRLWIRDTSPLNPHTAGEGLLLVADCQEDRAAKPMVTQEPDSGRLGSAPKDLRDSSHVLSFMESATLGCLGPLGLRGSITAKSNSAITFSKTKTSEGALHIPDIVLPTKG